MPIWQSLQVAFRSSAVLAIPRVAVRIPLQFQFSVLPILNLVLLPSVAILFQSIFRRVRYAEEFPWNWKYAFEQKLSWKLDSAHFARVQKRISLAWLCSLLSGLHVATREGRLEAKKNRNEKALFCKHRQLSRLRGPIFGIIASPKKKSSFWDTMWWKSMQVTAAHEK